MDQTEGHIASGRREQWTVLERDGDTVSGGIDRLRRSLGGRVQRVLVEVLFYSVERRGSIGHITVEFRDGRRFLLGCAGDGSVLVVAPGKNVAGPAPGFTRQDRDIAELTGPLTSVDVRPTSLVLTIGRHQLEIRNEDDELFLAVR